MEDLANVSVDGRTNRVVLSGELDLVAFDEVHRVLTEGLHPDGSVTVNMEAVTFIDSSGVRLLLGLVHEGHRLTLVQVPDQAMRVLDLCGLACREGIKIVPLASPDEGRP